MSGDQSNTNLDVHPISPAASISMSSDWSVISDTETNQQNNTQNDNTISQTQSNTISTSLNPTSSDVHGDSDMDDSAVCELSIGSRQHSESDESFSSDENNERHHNIDLVESHIELVPADSDHQTNTTPTSKSLYAQYSTLMKQWYNSSTAVLKQHSHHY